MDDDNPAEAIEDTEVTRSGPETGSGSSETFDIDRASSRLDDALVDLIRHIGEKGGTAVVDPNGRITLKPKRDHESQWRLFAGIAFAALTLIYLMVVSLLPPIPKENRFPLLLVAALGFGLSAGVLGGAAKVQGSLPLPLQQAASKHPVAFSLTGGIAVAILVILLGWLIYLR